MKKVIVLLVLFPSIIFANTENSSLNSEVLCVYGTIDTLQFNSDATLTIWIEGHNYYTDRNALQPLLFEALKDHTPVEIITSDCRNGGGFAHIRFDYDSGLI